LVAQLHDTIMLQGSDADVAVTHSGMISRYSGGLIPVFSQR
jgi:hypothetical protein